MHHKSSFFFSLFLSALCLSLPFGHAAEPKAQPADKGGIVAVYNLQGDIPDTPPVAEDFMAWINQNKTPSFYHLLRALTQAETDAKVRGVVLMLEGAGLEPNQIQELRGAIQRLKAADKPVWAYIQDLSLSTLWLASEASMLALMPQGNVHLQGIYMEQMYFKGLLDKIGVQADVIHIGDFKSAGEPFTRTEPSPESALQTNELLDDVHATILRDIAASRGRTTEEIQHLMDRGSISPEVALSEKLVDRLMYRNAFTRAVRKGFGGSPELDFSYGIETEKYANKGFTGWMDIFSGPKKKKSSTQNAVALVAMDGEIDDGSIQIVRREILRAARDKSIKALVFRVNSPGGSATSSDSLYEATRIFKLYKKPLIVSMGAVAASGGYYISALADRIYASETTITGSIGVVGGKVVYKDLMDWAGINVTTFKRGKHAGIYAGLHPFTPEEAQLIRGESERVYGVFKDAVLKGRRDRIRKDLDSIAGGRVYSGADALELGLVDEIGGLNDAIHYAAKQADLGTDYELRYLPATKDMGEQIMEWIDGPKPDEDFVISPRPSLKPLLAQLVGESHLFALQRLDPVRAAALQRFLSNLETLHSGQILMAAPYWIFRTN